MSESTKGAPQIDPAATAPANTISVAIPLDASAMPVDGYRA